MSRIRTFTTRLPEEYAVQLDAIAAIEGCSVASLVRQAIEQLIELYRHNEEFRARASEYQNSFNQVSAKVRSEI